MSAAAPLNVLRLISINSTRAVLYDAKDINRAIRQRADAGILVRFPAHVSGDIEQGHGEGAVVHRQY